MPSVFKKKKKKFGGPFLSNFSKISAPNALILVTICSKDPAFYEKKICSVDPVRHIPTKNKLSAPTKPIVAI